MRITSGPPAAALAFVLATSAAQARGWDWFAAHVRPTGGCVGAREVGASFYDSGTRTASGERFDRSAMTAASRPGGWPMGATVRVTNPKTGRSVTVRVNDAGPWGAAWAAGVRLDLSPAAFRALGMTQSDFVCAE